MKAEKADGAFKIRSRTALVRVLGGRGREARDDSGAGGPRLALMGERGMRSGVSQGEVGGAQSRLCSLRSGTGARTAAAPGDREGHPGEDSGEAGCGPEEEAPAGAGGRGPPLRGRGCPRGAARWGDAGWPEGRARPAVPGAGWGRALGAESALEPRGWPGSGEKASSPSLEDGGPGWENWGCVEGGAPGRASFV